MLGPIGTSSKQGRANVPGDGPSLSWLLVEGKKAVD